MCPNVPIPPETVEISAPEKLDETHDLTQFDCGVLSLNDYLREARKHQDSKSAVVFVICRKDTRVVVGYSTLSSGSILRSTAPGRLSRNAPREIPLFVLGRMGVDTSIQGLGYGKDLLAAAMEMASEASERVGSRALLVTALNEDLFKFYQQAGFTPMPQIDMTLYLKL
ncbi:MAG: GNAT family N-acetyltransferase [Pseudomonas sp.]